MKILENMSQSLPGTVANRPESAGLKVAFIGSGSAFALNIAETLDHQIFSGASLVLMDVHQASLDRSHEAVRRVLTAENSTVRLSATTSLPEALDGARYVIISCELDRYRNWIKDIEIPQKHGAHQVLGENGGPGGQIHAMRNIGMLLPIVDAIQEYCPDAWVLNLTNPMSVLCTYLSRQTKIKYAGFCHQVHGSFGVVAEQLGFEPGELQVVSAGINHLNWLFDLRRRSTGKCYLSEFLRQIEKSSWWTEKHPQVPEHRFSLEIQKTFEMYPIGFDDHIAEYFSCFYSKEEWEDKKISSPVESIFKPMVTESESTMDRTLKAQHLMADGGKGSHPFPKNPQHPYYRETVCEVIAALETNEPLYLDAMVGENKGAISNLPAEAVVDRPVVVVGGQVRSVHVGELPPGPLEVCRRQIALHEMVVQATVEGDEALAVQALCLDPYVHSLTQARAIWADFRKEYSDSLPTFR